MDTLMKTFIASLMLLTISVLPNCAEDLQWTTQLVHYEFSKPYDAWVISPASDSAGERRGFRETVEAIYSQDKNPRIEHVYLGTLFTRHDLQTEVVSYLMKQKCFRDSLPASGKRTFTGNSQTQKLVSQALLQCKFVNSLNEVLSPRKQRINSVSMEKLFFTREDDDKIMWHAVIWLVVKPSVYQSSAANADRRPRPPNYPSEE